MANRWTRPATRLALAVCLSVATAPSSARAQDEQTAGPDGFSFQFGSIFNNVVNNRF